MDIRSTKTPAERQEDEAARLVRPAPKYKPPRRDRRRERNNSDQEVDPDETADRKDRSENYKNVGGSAFLVTARYLWAMEFPTEEAKKQYLKEHPDADPSKHTVQEQEQGPAAEGEGTGRPKGKKDKGEGKPGPAEKDLVALGDKLHQLAKSDKALKSQFKLFQPGGFYDGMARENPDFEVTRLPWSKALPPEFKGLTLGDIRDAWLSKGKTQPGVVEPKAAPPEVSAPEEAAPQETPVQEAAPQVDQPAEEAAPPEQKDEAASPTEAAPPEPEQVTPPKAKGKKRKRKKKLQPESEVPVISEPKVPAIPEPVRPKASLQEKVQAHRQLQDVLGDYTAQELAKSGLHPQDIASLVDMYQAVASKPEKDLGAYASKVSQFYETNPKRVPPPKEAQAASGDVVPFEQLSPEEQGEAYRRHQLRTVAISLAAERGIRGAIAKTLPKGTDSRVAGELAAVMLQPKGKSRSAWASKAAKRSYETALQAGGSPVPAKNVQALLASLGDNQDAQKIAVAYLQGQDFNAAKNIFLSQRGSGAGSAVKKGLGWAADTATGAVKLLWDLLVDKDSDYAKPNVEAAQEVVDEYQSISEWSTPKQIGKAIRGADRFMQLRARNYPDHLVGEYDPSVLFRQQVLERIKTLSPGKYAPVRALLEEYDFNDYEHKQAEYEDRQIDWEQERDLQLHQVAGRDPEVPKRKKFRSDEEYQQAVEAHAAMTDERKAALAAWEEENPPPKPPVKPANYDRTRNPKALRDMRKWLLAEQFSQFGGKTAASVAARFVISSYPTPSSMASVSEKAAVYNGVAPYPNTPAYVPWTQPAQRDIGEGDLEVILKSAQDWLGMPVLKFPLDGTPRDIQLRAALDLAIYSGPFNGAIQPTVYNILLSRLAGVDAHETLLTIRKQAGYSFGTDKMTVAFWGKNPVNRDVRAAIEEIDILFDDDEGKPHQDRVLQTVGMQSGTPLNHVEEKEGLLRESTITVEFPKGADLSALAALKAVGRKFGLQVEKVKDGYKPTYRGERKKPKEYKSPLLRGRHSNEVEKVTTMKASTEIRKMAAKYAAENAALAYDLMDLANKVAQDEQDQGQQDQGQQKQAAADKYASLRSTVIQVAAKNPEARAAFLPILQAIKGLGN